MGGAISTAVEMTVTYPIRIPNWESGLYVLLSGVHNEIWKIDGFDTYRNINILFIHSGKRRIKRVVRPEVLSPFSLQIGDRITVKQDVRYIENEVERTLNAGIMCTLDAIGTMTFPGLGEAYCASVIVAGSGVSYFGVMLSNIILWDE